MRASKHEQYRAGEIAEMSVGLAVQPPGAQLTVLWIPPPRGFAAARRAGLINVSRSEYLARLAAVERRLDDAGVPHERLTAPARDVTEALAASGLANTPENRSRIYLELWIAGKGNP